MDLVSGVRPIPLTYYGMLHYNSVTCSVSCWSSLGYQATVLVWAVVRAHTCLVNNPFIHKLQFKINELLCMYEFLYVCAKQAS